MFTFTFSKLNKMGEYDEKYGQTYWGEVNEDLKPVKFNSQNANITENDTIECEERSEKKSSKGTIYNQLKKVRIATIGVSENTTAPSPSPFPSSNTQLDRIEAKLDQLLGLDTKNQNEEFNLPEDY